MQLHIEGMMCTSCAAAVEKALSKVPHVEVAQVNFAGRKALLSLDEAVDADRATQIEDQLRRAVRDAGYEVVDPEERRAESMRQVRRERNRMIWAWVFTLPLMVNMLLTMVWGVHVLPPVAESVVPLVISAVVVFGVGWPVIAGTINSIRNLAFTMDSLIGIGSVAAISTGVLRLAGVEIGNFTAVAAMIVAINYIGNYIKVRATGRASSAIQQLLELGAKRASRLREDGSEEEIDVAALAVGDVVRVRPGRKIPADGTVISGSTSVDESIVTGESVPADKGEGSSVIGATINQMGTIDVRVGSVGGDTVLAQIVDLVEEAQASKVPVQETADRITAIFVPAILVLATLTFAGWMALTATGVVGNGTMNVSAALSAAIATLVIACPCALGLATPTALMVGMGYGAERGILVRSGESIQIARSVDTVVFDKTGTLTIGRPEVRDAWTANEHAHTFTRAIEERSEHPLARAVAAYVSEQAPDSAGSETSEVEALPGQGIRGRVDGRDVFVGNLRRLEADGARPSGEAEERVRTWRETGKTIVGTAVDGELVALYALSDAIKDDATRAIRRLHELGMRTAMLTGDTEAAARTIAQSAGIDEVFAELQPQDKIAAIQKLQTNGRVVAMVGDGINDAPALRQSDVGIAVGTGTDIAIESAGITLMSSNLEMIPRAFEISKSTFAKIRTNLFWAFAYNIVAIPLAVLGVLHPIVAEIAMAFSSITVVTNSLHLKRRLQTS